MNISPENSELVLIGQTEFRDKPIKFGIKTDDRRRHFYIIGRSGTGKSTLQETLAVYDINHGRGLGLLDPHGEFSERILNFIPQDRVEDVVYFNPSDSDYPIGFNVMEAVGYEKRHIVASSLLSVFKKIWPDVWSARMEYILSNTILALLEYPDSTLLSINRMLSDKDFRKEVVHNLKDPVIKAFWTDEFARYHDRFQVEAIAPLQNKVGQFTSNPLIRDIVGQKVSKIDLREIMDNRKILIMRLPTGLIGESNSSLLGGLLITKLQQAALSRINVSESERQDFYLYIDEFQNFATESFVTILSEARKYRLNLILAHQYIEQIPESIQAAILGNVGSLAVFRIGPRDAEILKTEFEPTLAVADLVGLPNWKFYIKLMIDGVASDPFLASTLKPPEAPEISYEAQIIQRSREKYSSDRGLVEAEISAWMQTVAGEEVDKEKALDKEPAETYPGVCQMCGRGINVPFKPDPNKPLYCKQCLKKVRQQKTGAASIQAVVPKPTAPAFSEADLAPSAPVSTSPIAEEKIVPPRRAKPTPAAKPKTKEKTAKFDKTNKRFKKQLADLLQKVTAEEDQDVFDKEESTNNE